jgi:hypothetical protein
VTKRTTQANNRTNKKASKILGVTANALQTVGEADDEFTFENSVSDSLTDSIDKEVMNKMLSPSLSVKSLTNVMGELKNGPKQIFAGISVEERTAFAFNEMRNKIQREVQEIEKYHATVRRMKNEVSPKSPVKSDAASVTMPTI